MYFYSIISLEIALKYKPFFNIFIETAYMHTVLSRYSKDGYSITMTFKTGNNINELFDLGFDPSQLIKRASAFATELFKRYSL